MLANLANGGAGALESLLEWWRLAGVDVLVDDTPRDWLRAVPPAETPRAAPAAAVPAAPALPESISALDELLSAPDFLPMLGHARLAGSGDPASGIMILTDMPDPGDFDAGQLFAGPAGRLLDAMLAAIGLTRGHVHLAPVLPGRSADGNIDPAIHAEAVRLAAHRVTLAGPRVVLLFGDATTRAMCGTNLAEIRNGNPALNHVSGQVSAIASFHPRFLLQHPARKADAWKDLRRLVELSRS